MDLKSSLKIANVQMDIYTNDIYIKIVSIVLIVPGKAVKKRVVQ